MLTRPLEIISTFREIITVFMLFLLYVKIKEYNRS